MKRKKHRNEQAKVKKVKIGPALSITWYNRKRAQGLDLRVTCQTLGKMVTMAVTIDVAK